MDLYRALTDLPGGDAQLRTTYVGDPRQSIYLFRGAEPRIFDAIREEAVAGKTHEALDVNRRATPALNDAQRALFNQAEAFRLAGVDSIEGVRALAPNARKQLAPDHPFEAPVVLVVPDPEADWNAAAEVEATVDVLLQRLDAARAEPGHAGDTAAVLAPTWSKTQVACARIRALRGPHAAHIEGNKGLFQTRVARDVAIWLRALWDSGDALAWAAVWRHPMVGITDAGLIRLRDGLGLLDADGAPLEAHGLGTVNRAHALDPAIHDPIDVATFARVAPVLRASVARLGREGTAGVLDAAFASLRWRLLLRVGPEGDEDVARLEVLLDLVRQAEQAGVDPDAALRALTGTDGTDAPKVHLDRGRTSIACTTIFQAKGLAWDHVGVVAIGGRSDGGRPSTRQRVSWQGEEMELVGVKLDPTGALKPVEDPVARVAKAVANARGDQERLRCAYVALTRARRSVTVGLHPDGKKNGIHTQLAACWLEGPLHGVQVAPMPTPAPAIALVRGHVLASGQLSVEPVRPRGRTVVSPSSLHDHLDVDERAARLDAVLDDAQLSLGLPAVSLSAAVRGLPANVRGSLVHAWLGAGGLHPTTATEDAARAFLAEVRPDLHADTFAPWLVAVSTRIDRTWPGDLADLRAPDAAHAFELPVLAPEAHGTDTARLLNGSIDLVVQRADGTVDIIDFKGEQAPTALSELRSQAGFRENVLQVDAYRRALQATGLTVGRCCLLYTATGTWVSWGA
jgi:ATP-dependent exoDNAse (exonuclease V) beta subunit